MKSHLIQKAFVITILLFGSSYGFSQGFVNLNFENAVIIPDPSSPDYPIAVYASDAIPAWTPTGFLGPNDVHYNNVSLGSTDVSILGINGSPPALNGSFSVSLYGGFGEPAASISQTAVVPSSAEAILFKAQGSGGILLVSLGSQDIPFSAISTGQNYTLYGGNIPSGSAGQSEQLMFSALAGINNFWNIDDIQFLTSTVPEPATWTLLLCGAGLLGVMRQLRQQ